MESEGVQVDINVYGNIALPVNSVVLVSSVKTLMLISLHLAGLPTIVLEYILSKRVYILGMEAPESPTL